MATSETRHAEIDQLIADEFGVNADYVSELLARFQGDRTAVDDDWASFFDEMLSNGRVATEFGTIAPVV